ncbi:alpha/beta fold hydrolase [Acinetobacter sp. ANC 4635]|uniref:alpha/beta hydrolase n=1 Tax=Acinetobacter sp. ANC 4635 TaxID=2529846 RepID=UPI00103E2CD6|nr:alpha/beta fold hydrolase [Acinetobacter sp. ANC 4635]TCB30863.1 alpha/beta fold hydrolase [Acinetobacter sp. ANC 4635]
MQYQVENIYFTSCGERLAADVYFPQEIALPPVIIMANGFACERKFSLPDVAERFAEQGFAVILFDYRGFGESTGQPRELVSPKHHLQDWKSVVEQVKSWSNVNQEQLFLWGVSLSGGHVMTLAAEIPNIKAIIALVPHVDGLASAWLYPKKLLPQALKLALQDLWAARFGRVVGIPVVSKEGICCLAGEGCYDAFMESVPENSTWKNCVPARILLEINTYRPTHIAKKIKCPTLMIAAQDDWLIPITATRKAAHKIQNVQFIEWSMTHFDIVHKQSAIFEQSIQTQLQFLKHQLQT